MLSLRTRVDLGAIAKKGYSAFPKMFCIISKTLFEGEGLTSQQRCSWYIRKPQQTGPGFGSVLWHINYFGYLMPNPGFTYIEWFVNLFGRYMVPSITFQTFFIQAFKIVADSWQFSMLLLYILWNDWPILMFSGLNEQLQQQLEYTLQKPDCHSWWISKMTQKQRMERFRLLLDHLTWIEH